MLDYILGSILIAASLFLIIAVLLQSSKSSKGVSSTISGGAETFFGKNKGKSIDKKLSILTIIVAVIFILTVLVVFISQPYTNYNDWYSDVLKEWLGANSDTNITVQ